MTDEQLRELVRGALTSVSARVVIALVTVLTPAFTAAAFWLQNELGVDLQEHTAVAVTFVGTLMTGGFSLGILWLVGNQKFMDIIGSFFNIYLEGKQEEEREGSPPRTRKSGNVDISPLDRGVDEEGH
jgi:hypothetical protein